MPQTKPIISIENVVASASVDQKMDLNDITKNFPNVEYHPDQFPGLVFRLTNPKTATLVFTSGKMVCTGSKSEDMARKAVSTVVDKLRKGGISIKKDATVRITSVEAIEGKTRIALGVIDTGERTMQVIIGGADKFDPTSLIGVQAVAVTNMVPKTIAGITSEAMLLAADVDGVPFWLTPNGQVPDGTLIK